MKAFVLLLALAAPAFAQTAAQMGMTEEEHANMHKLPPGTGAAPDGGAYLHIEVPGVYVIHNAQVLGYPNSDRVLAAAGSWLRILPHKGPLIWTRPDGVREPVPLANLYTPTPIPR